MVHHHPPTLILVLAFVIPNLYSFGNDKNIISSIFVTNILCDNHLGKWNYREIPKVKTQSYFLNIP